MSAGWDAAIDFFKQHKKDDAQRYCEMMKRRKQPPPIGYGTATPGRSIVEWPDRPPVFIGEPPPNV